MKKKISVYTAEECEKVAASAALRYVNDSMPGIYRNKKGKDFVYCDSSGNRITEEATLDRIKALGIPPAYEKVWICKMANGHIQATGIDAKGRKQYIYHKLWQEARQQQKFDSLIEFGHCLPKIRRHIKRELDKKIELNKEQVLCAIIYLLDTSCVRIGSSRYAKDNHSFGLTTLRKKHLSVTKQKAILDFPGKNAQPWHVILEDKRLIKLLKKCEEIPGVELFKYYSGEKELHIITSQDVNGYLQSLTHHPFTAKNFRTWVACREFLCRAIRSKNATLEKSFIKEVAKLLGHTPTICKKNYIEPGLISCWKEGSLESWIRSQKKQIRNKDKLLLSWLEYKKTQSSL